MHKVQKRVRVARKDERGFASMVVALTLIIILSLITVGFAQLTRREQQDALNKQLATQANYAAETGINDAYSYLQEGGTLPAGTDTNCTALKGDPANFNYTIDSTNAVSYTCLLVDTALTNYEYQDIQPGDGQSVSFSVSSHAPLNLTIEWDSSDAISLPNIPNNVYGEDSFNPAAGGGGGTTNWSSPAVVQLSVTPLGVASTPINRTNLIDNTFTTYLYPTGGVGAQAADDTAPSNFTNNAASLASDIYYNTTELYNDENWQGEIDAGNCTPSHPGYKCIAELKGICLYLDPPWEAGGNGQPASGAVADPTQPPSSLSQEQCGVTGQQYLIHLLDYYDTSNITISGGTGVTFSGGQVLIDSTGKAQDVLKRLQVRVPGESDTNLNQPNYAIEAQNICKRLRTTPSPGTTNFIALDGQNASSSDDPGCVLSP